MSPADSLQMQWVGCVSCGALEMCLEGKTALLLKCEINNPDDPRITMKFSESKLTPWLNLYCKLLKCSLKHYLLKWLVGSKLTL